MIQKQNGATLNNISSPRTGAMGNTNNNNDQNIISSFDQIEEARIELEDFKKNVLDLVSLFDELMSKINQLNLANTLNFNPQNYGTKVQKVKHSVGQVEQILEGLTQGFTKQLNETHTQNLQIERDRDELSQSLHQIELCYQ